MENISQMSLLEVALNLMEQKKAPQSIHNLIKEVLEIKGLEDVDNSLATQLYIDITTSSKFVFLGDDNWDLKNRQSLDEYDKDGSAFNVKGEDLEEELLDEEESLETLDEEDDYNDYDEDDEDDYDEDDEDSEYDDYDEDDEEAEDSEYDEDDVDAIIDGEITERYSEDDFNEDKYNDLMDDYEDMYEE